MLDEVLIIRIMIMKSNNIYSYWRTLDEKSLNSNETTYFLSNSPLTKKNTYDRIIKMCVEGRVKMENLFITSTKYTKVQAANTFISISKNNYNFYKKTDFIND